MIRHNPELSDSSAKLNTEIRGLSFLDKKLQHSNKHINPRDHGNLAFHTEMFKFAHSFIFKSSIRRLSLYV